MLCSCTHLPTFPFLQKLSQKLFRVTQGKKAACTYLQYYDLLIQLKIVMQVDETTATKALAMQVERESRAFRNMRKFESRQEDGVHQLIPWLKNTK